MPSQGVRGRRLLREWRTSQRPRVSQAELGRCLGKTGRLIGLFETDDADLTTRDCVRIHRCTGIPLGELLSAEQCRHIHEASELLETGAPA